MSLSLSMGMGMGISVVFSRGMDECLDCGERERLCIYPLVGPGGLYVSWPRALEHHIISCFSSLLFYCVQPFTSSCWPSLLTDMSVTTDINR
jgi:hypothetical protein